MIIDLFKKSETTGRTGYLTCIEASDIVPEQHRENNSVGIAPPNSTIQSMIWPLLHRRVRHCQFPKSFYHASCRTGTDLVTAMLCTNTLTMLNIDLLQFHYLVSMVHQWLRQDGSTKFKALSWRPEYLVWPSMKDQGISMTFCSDTFVMDPFLVSSHTSMHELLLSCFWTNCLQSNECCSVYFGFNSYCTRITRFGSSTWCGNFCKRLLGHFYCSYYIFSMINSRPCNIMPPGSVSSLTFFVHK